MSQPLVSIGVPVYNGARTLRRAIDSALAQDYPNLEVIISDNASDDGTPAICEEYAGRDSRVRYVRQASSIRGIENFKRVLAAARGELFMWLGDDDWIDDNYVSSCAKLLREQPEYMVAAGHGNYFVEGKFNFTETMLNTEEASAKQRVLSYFRQVDVNGLFYGLMRRDLMCEPPLKDVVAGDWLFVSQMAVRGKMKTLPNTAVNRSLSGLSQNVETLGRLHNLSEFKKNNLFSFIAYLVFKEIAWRSVVYRPLGRVTRLVLACRCAAIIIIKRNVRPWWNALRARLILRTRLKRFVARYLRKGSANNLAAAPNSSLPRPAGSNSIEPGEPDESRISEMSIKNHT